jgi:hypothetical protein
MYSSPAMTNYRGSEDQTNGLHARHQSEDFFNVDIGLLHVLLFDEASLVLDNHIGRMLLHLVD